MPDPYTIVDTVVVAQLREYAPLLALVSVGRIHWQERAVDAADPPRGYDNRPIIVISPTLSPENPYISSETSETVLVYEITIIMASGKAEEMRAIQWQIRRTISRMMSYISGTGADLRDTQPTPFKWGITKITQFTNVQDGPVLRSIATLEKEIMASEAEIQA